MAINFLHSANTPFQRRFYCKKIDESSAAAASPPADKINILGSVKGLGIAEDVLKQKQNDSSSEDQLKASSPDLNEEDEEAKRQKEAEASWRTMKYSLIFMGVTMSGLAGFLVAAWGAPEVDEEGNLIRDQFSDQQIVIQYFKRSWNAVMNYSQVFYSLFEICSKINVLFNAIDDS